MHHAMKGMMKSKCHAALAAGVRLFSMQDSECHNFVIITVLLFIVFRTPSAQLLLGRNTLMSCYEDRRLARE